MTKRMVAAAVGLLAALAVGACSAVWGFQTLTLEEDASPGDSALPDAPRSEAEGSMRDAAVSDAALSDVAEGGCVHARWPAPPQDIDAGPGLPEIVFAMSSFDTDPNTTIGLDLDDQCTSCPPSTMLLTNPSCVTPPPFSATGGSMQVAAECDLANGQDVTGNRLLQQLGQADLPSDSGGLGPAGLMGEVTTGLMNLLIRLRSYNGLANDRQVEVELFLSPGTLPQDDAGTPTPPKLDGTDTWQALPLFAADAGTNINPNSFRSAFFDLAAYVTDNVLVASPFDPNTKLTGILFRPGLGNGNPLLLHLSGFVLRATLTPHDGGPLTLEDGLFGGRMVIEGQFGILGDVAAIGVCEGNAAFGLLQSAVCSYRDIMTNGADDNKDASCDAISFSAAFRATTARMAPVVPINLAPVCEAGSTSCSQ